MPWKEALTETGRAAEKGCGEEGGAVGGEASLALGHREREGVIRNIQTDGGEVGKSGLGL